MVVMMCVVTQQALYDKGGLLINLGEEEWHFVPVVAFIANDTKGAKLLKHTFGTWKCQFPCHICMVPFDFLNRAGNFPLRTAKEMVEASKKYWPTYVKARVEQGGTLHVLTPEERKVFDEGEQWSKEHSAHLQPTKLADAPLGCSLMQGGEETGYMLSAGLPEVLHQFESGLMKHGITHTQTGVKRDGTGTASRGNRAMNGDSRY